MILLQSELGKELGRDRRVGFQSYEKASLQALPIAPAPARIAALAVLAKEVFEVDLEWEAVCLATLPR